MTVIMEATAPTVAPQEAHYEMFRAVENAASNFPDRNAAIDKVLEVAAHMDFVHRSNIPDGVSKAWTNSDYQWACERLIKRLQATVDRIEATRF